MSKKVILIVFALILALSVIFFSNSNTTIPIPEPNLNSSTTTKGITIIAKNLEVPWAIDISKEGQIFFTEKAGRIRVIESNGSLIKDPVSEIKVHSDGEGGLLGLVLHPNFTENGLLYIYYTYLESDEIKNKVVLLREDNHKIVESKTIIDNIPGNNYHNGGRLKFGPDNKLYVTTGDANKPDLAQDLSSLGGKILRINDDGTIPSDNPFKNSIVFSLGHRNVQGLAWNSNAELFATDHGSSGNDEINMVMPGYNYGWPFEECQGVRYTGSTLCFTPAIAPSAATFLHSNASENKSVLLVTTLRGNHLRGIDLLSGQEDNLLVGYGRLREIIEDDNGYLYIATSNKDDRGISRGEDDKILKISNLIISK